MSDYKLKDITIKSNKVSITFEGNYHEVSLVLSHYRLSNYEIQIGEIIEYTGLSPALVEAMNDTLKQQDRSYYKDVLGNYIGCEAEKDWLHYVSSNLPQGVLLSVLTLKLDLKDIQTLIDIFGYNQKFQKELMARCQDL